MEKHKYINSENISIVFYTLAIVYYIVMLTKLEEQRKLTAYQIHDFEQKYGFLEAA